VLRGFCVSFIQFYPDSEVAGQRSNDSRKTDSEKLPNPIANFLEPDTKRISDIVTVTVEPDTRMYLPILGVHLVTKHYVREFGVCQATAARTLRPHVCLVLNSFA